MGSKLYVGNLSYATNEETLRAVFEGDGRQVQDVSIILDRETGRSRGFGFVQMASAEQAQAAIRDIDGQAVDGRTLRVTEARERERGPGRPRSGPRAGGPPDRRGNGAGFRGPDDRGGRHAPRGDDGFHNRMAFDPDGGNRDRGRGGRRSRGRRGGDRDFDRDMDGDGLRGGGGRSRGRNRDWKRDWEY